MRTTALVCGLAFICTSVAPSAYAEDCAEAFFRQSARAGAPNALALKIPHGYERLTRSVAQERADVHRATMHNWWDVEQYIYSTGVLNPIIRLYSRWGSFENALQGEGTWVTVGVANIPECSDELTTTIFVFDYVIAGGVIWSPQVFMNTGE
jgi:hypothetical protein